MLCCRRYELTQSQSQSQGHDSQAQDTPYQAFLVALVVRGTTFAFKSEVPFVEVENSFKSLEKYFVESLLENSYL